MTPDPVPATPLNLDSLPELPSGTPADSCIQELERVQVALNDADAGVAAVLLDMATEPCSAATSMLVELVGADPGGAGAPFVEILWVMEMRRALLLLQMESCEAARDTLGETAATVPLPEGLQRPFAIAAHAALACGPQPGIPTGGTLTISPHSPDLYHSGTTTGDQDASALGSDCWGSIPLAPNVDLEVTEAMELSVTATGADDLVLAIEGPMGTLCNDDYDGLNPGIGQFFEAGTYQIYVGQFSRSGFATAFDLTVSTSPLTTSYLYPTYGSASIGPGYGQTTLSGSVWGVNDAAITFDPTCSGWVGEMPDFQIYVEGGSETWISVTAASGTEVAADLTLIIDGPGGRHCIDDTSGLDPGFNGELVPGTYNLWIGDKAGVSSGAAYGIQFSSYDPMAVLGSEPTDGIAVLSEATPRTTLTGRAEGGLPASDFLGSACPGIIGLAPAHRLVLEQDGMVEVVSRATISGDLVIAVDGPSGTFCNDDFDGLNPGIRRWLSAGEYRIFVGPLSSYGAGSEFSTEIALIPGGEAPIDLSTFATGVFGTVTLHSGGAVTLGGRSGGDQLANMMDSTCRGYLSESPTFILEVPTAMTVSIQVMSEGDTTIALSGPDGIFCNDDSIGLNPGLDQFLSAGQYGVWVGSYSAGSESDFMATFRSYSY